MTPAPKERIDTPEAYARVLCNRVAERFKNPPRLRVIRDQEERAALRLCKARYKLSRLLAIMAWAHETSEWDGWRQVLTSVSALAKYLLEPKSVTDCLESRYDVWLQAHPTYCKHGCCKGNCGETCCVCAAKPDCPRCDDGNGHRCGQMSVRVPDTLTDIMVPCECTGLPWSMDDLVKKYGQPSKLTEDFGDEPVL